MFTSADIWAGGFYELALEYDSGTGSRLLDGLRSLWSNSAVQGCYLERSRDPADQQRVTFSAELAERGHILGIATLPTGKAIPCGTCTVCEADGSNWLVFYCTMGALGEAYPVDAFPFGDADSSWRAPLDQWFCEIGKAIFTAAPFRLGLIGFETSGLVHSRDLGSAAVQPRRDMALLVPSGSGVICLPRAMDLT